LCAINFINVFVVIVDVVVVFITHIIVNAVVVVRILIIVAVRTLIIVDAVDVFIDGFVDSTIGAMVDILVFFFSFTKDISNLEGIIDYLIDVFFFHEVVKSLADVQLGELLFKSLFDVLQCLSIEIVFNCLDI
jgi:uncharacterized MnhB-related membrane protein